MRRLFAFAAFPVIFAVPAFAIDMPARKPGLWELKMVFEGRSLPVTVMKQCVDSATDKLMNANFGGSAQEACSKQEVTQSAGTTIVDSVCKFSDTTTTSHAVVTGSFDSAYTVNVTSTREGGRPSPGAAPGAATHMTIQATWLGSCAVGQRPGDVIMADGITMNILDLRKPSRPPARR
jgi:hypothetical protein